MTHWKKLLDPADYLGPVDFPKEREVTISRMVREALPQRDGEKASSAPMMYILDKEGKEHTRPLKIPKTVMYGLSLHLGTDVDLWAGKKVVLFATKCNSFGEIDECVRVRFPDDIDLKIRKYLKKRKTNVSCYMITEQGAA